MTQSMDYLASTSIEAEQLDRKVLRNLYVLFIFVAEDGSRQNCRYVILG